jgi:hypothetical protein
MNFILLAHHMVTINIYIKNPLVLFTYLFVYLLCKAGHFIPSLAKLIVQKNRYAAQQGRLYIPLQSIMIGNGFFNYNEQQLSYADYSCSTDSKCKYPIPKKSS